MVAEKLPAESATVSVSLIKTSALGAVLPFIVKEELETIVPFAGEEMVRRIWGRGI
jgi:hypothetical protein